MTDFIRRIVSGNKARFKDSELKLELDLVYITDQIIIMGYPATGIEGMYRNRREDAKKFLDSRHPSNYWIFNFCPIKENSYDAQVFDGRVSRYPFPDHHAPPLAIMPLLAREMQVWLDGSPDRVAVLHCKAGKGRSGTMACTYLLACDTEVAAPKLQRSYNAKHWANRLTQKAIDTIPDDENDASTAHLRTDSETPPESTTLDKIIEEDTQVVESPVPSSTTLDNSVDIPKKSFTKSLKDVLDLHTSQRMKQPSDGGKAKQGVSIPSQRRWLYYWALLLSREAPAHLWAIESPVPSPFPSPGNSDTKLSMSSSKKRLRPKVRLTEITLRLKELSGVRMNLVRAANAVLDRTSVGKSGSVEAKANGNGDVWVSLARYDDDFVETLEQWERYTRDDTSSGLGNMGRRKKGSDHLGNEVLSDIFKDGKWDDKKMVRSFARMGATGENAVRKSESEDGKIITYSLRPLSDSRWKKLREGLEKDKPSDEASIQASASENDFPASETNSIADVTQSAKEKGIVLDAGREVRVKLYMGQVFLGWAWFIPTFHMPQPPPSSSSSSPQPSSISSTFRLTRKELDFPLGVGSSVIDVEISLEWLRESDPEAVMQPPTRMSTEEEKKHGMGRKTSGGHEPDGLAAAVQAVAAGEVGEMVDVKQAVET